MYNEHFYLHLLEELIVTWILHELVIICVCTHVYMHI